jgi:hypothetical protein
MARSNPFIRKPRQPNWTVLAVGEGETDKAFLKYLKARYIKREDGISIKVECAHGGGPECVITHSIKLNPRNYDGAFALLDADRPCRSSYLKKAKEKRLELIWSDPCIEGLLLKILDPAFNPSVHKSSECKKLFESHYLNKDEKLVPEKYVEYFPLDLLENHRRQVPELDRLIRLMSKDPG